jgi:hypothetical protein
VGDAVIVPKDRRQPGHAFPTDHADFDGALSVGNDRSDTAVDEIDVPDPPSRCLQHRAHGKVDGLETRFESKAKSSRDKRDNS